MNIDKMIEKLDEITKQFSYGDREIVLYGVLRQILEAGRGEPKLTEMQALRILFNTVQDDITEHEKRLSKLESAVDDIVKFIGYLPPSEVKEKGEKLCSCYDGSGIICKEHFEKRHPVPPEAEVCKYCRNELTESDLAEGGCSMCGRAIVPPEAKESVEGELIYLIESWLDSDEPSGVLARSIIRQFPEIRRAIGQGK